MSNSIEYVIGDATDPIGEGNKLLIHICNDIGAWGAGFVLAVSSKWESPERMYQKWYTSKIPMELGKIQKVPVEEGITVVNMIAQHGIGFYQGAPIRYHALRQCLMKVAREALRTKSTVHMPRIGCGLAGGDWDTVKEIVYEELIDKGIDVTVYDLKA